MCSALGPLSGCNGKCRGIFQVSESSTALRPYCSSKGHAAESGTIYITNFLLAHPLGCKQLSSFPLGCMRLTCQPGMMACRLVGASPEDPASGSGQPSGMPRLPRLLRLEVPALTVAPVPTLVSGGCDVVWDLSLAPTLRRTLSRAFCRENAGLGECPRLSSAQHRKSSATAEDQDLQVRIVLHMAVNLNLQAVNLNLQPVLEA